MKIKVHDISWGFNLNLPKEQTLEVRGDWFDWFSDEEKCEALDKEIERQLQDKFGFKPEFFLCTGVDVEDDNGDN